MVRVADHEIYEPVLPEMNPLDPDRGTKGQGRLSSRQIPLKIQGTSAHRPVQRGSGAAVGGMNAKA